MAEPVECRTCLHARWHHVGFGAEMGACYVFKCRCKAFEQRRGAVVRLRGVPTLALMYWRRLWETIDRALEIE